MSSYPPELHRILKTSDGKPMPYYLVPFDKKGTLRSPSLRDALVEDLGKEKYTHVIIFSHGWNNTFETANKRYNNFIQGMGTLRRVYGLDPISVDFKPLLVGIFWPSTALAFGPDEVGPDVSLQALTGDPATLEESVLIDEIASEIDPGDLARFYELSGKEGVTSSEAEELVKIVARQAVLDDDVATLVGELKSSVEPSHLLEAWEEVQAEELKFRQGAVEAPEIHALGVPKFLDPRWLIRMLSVRYMKKRSGVVGSAGVAALLTAIRGATSGCMHLIGHSYGTKVLLSAVEHMKVLSGEEKPICSMLLLQGAISGLAFASNVQGKNKAGRYVSVLDRVTQPIICTYSTRDFPLHKIYHLIFRRDGDVGDIAALAADVASVSPFAALGGYGPQQVGVPGTALPFPPVPLPPIHVGTHLYGFDGSAHIAGHGDISNFATWWLLYQQLREAC